jgi:hypothetical protein
MSLSNVPHCNSKHEMTSLTILALLVTLFVQFIVIEKTPYNVNSLKEKEKLYGWIWTFDLRIVSRAFYHCATGAQPTGTTWEHDIYL